MLEVDLLKEFSYGQYTGALMTSYGLDFHFFERDILRQLNALGSRINIVFIDMQQSSRSLLAGSAAGSAGLRYLLRPTGGISSFHPKVFLLLGRESGKLILGSANISINGFYRNREVVSVVKYPEDGIDSRNLINEALEFFEITAKLSSTDDEFISDRLQRLRGFCEWLNDITPTTDSGANFVHSYDRSMIEHLAAIEKVGRARRIVLFSPFYDEKCQAVKRIIDIFNPFELIIIAQNEPSGARTNLDGALLGQLCRKESCALQIMETKEDNGHRRWLHAKGVVIEFEGSSSALFGSANLTVNGFLRSFNSGGNIEAGILLERPDSNYFNDLIDGIATESYLKAHELEFFHYDSEGKAEEEEFKFITAIYASLLPDGTLLFGYIPPRDDFEPMEISVILNDIEINEFEEILIEKAGLIRIKLRDEVLSNIKKPSLIRLSCFSKHDSDPKEAYQSNVIWIDYFEDLFHEELAGGGSERIELYKQFAEEEESLDPQLKETLLHIIELMRKDVEEASKDRAHLAGKVEDEEEEQENDFEDELEIAERPIFTISEAELDEREAIREIASGEYDFSQSVVRLVAKYLWRMKGDYGIQDADIAEGEEENGGDERIAQEDFPQQRRSSKTFRKLEYYIKRMFNRYHSLVAEAPSALAVALWRYWPHFAFACICIEDALETPENIVAEIAEDLIEDGATICHNAREKGSFIGIKDEAPRKDEAGDKEVIIEPYISRLAVKLCYLALQLYDPHEQDYMQKKTVTRDYLREILNSNVKIDFFSSEEFKTHLSKIEGSEYIFDIELDDFEIDKIAKLLTSFTIEDLKNRCTELQKVIDIQFLHGDMWHPVEDKQRSTLILNLLFSDLSSKNIAESVHYILHYLLKYQPQENLHIVDLDISSKGAVQNSLRIIYQEREGSIIYMDRNRLKEYFELDGVTREEILSLNSNLDKRLRSKWD